MKLKVNWKELGKQLWAAMKPVLLVGVSDEQPAAMLTIPPPIAARSTGFTAAHNCFPSSFQLTFTFMTDLLSL